MVLGSNQQSNAALAACWMPGLGGIAAVRAKAVERLDAAALRADASKRLSSAVGCHSIAGQREPCLSRSR